MLLLAQLDLTLGIQVAAVLLSLFNGALLCLVSYRCLLTLQQGGYRPGGYFGRIKDSPDKYFSRLFMLCFMSASALLAINILFMAFARGYIGYISLLVYFFYLMAYIKNDFGIKRKTPLVYTNRVKRLMGVMFLLCSALTMGLFYLSFWLTSLHLPAIQFIFICFTPAASPIVALAAFYIMQPYETAHNRGFLKKARKKLEGMPALIRVGVTGSYGKTSVKNILAEMLKTKYRVVATPGNYNTPLGLTKVILKSLPPDTEVLIAEMGARRRGDIAELCRLVRPSAGLITGIACQHMETFGSVENIMDTKFELAESLSENGFAAFNADTAEAFALYERCKGEKLYTSVSRAGGAAEALDIDAGPSGCTFTLVICGESVRCMTRLLGIHNISNILLCAAAAHRMGVPLPSIAEAVYLLEPVPHRLEYLPGNGVHILDDSYNASPAGTKAALDVLRRFGSGKRVVVTPGMIEMGGMQNDVNYAFGRDIAAAATDVILVGEKQTEPIRAGLADAGFPQDRIAVVPSLAEARARLSGLLVPGDTVLFENDLPNIHGK